MVRSPLSDLVERFGILALIQHCQELKRRNVIEHLLQEQHAGVGNSMHEAWNRTNDEKLGRDNHLVRSSDKHDGRW